MIKYQNEIIDIIINNVTYKIWTVKLIKPFVNKFLKEKYLDSIIVPEINQIDNTLIDNKSDEIIPVEIQRTVLRHKTDYRKSGFTHSTFEDYIRRQINTNIRDYGKCWFFMDSEYLRYLQSDDIKNTTVSIDMSWVVELIQENKLKVFGIRYDGVVKELTIKDFDFLKELYTVDEAIINKNKLKILRNIIKGHKFTQEEIDKFYTKFSDNKLNNDNKKSCSSYFINSDDERCKLYGHILYSIGDLNLINDVLDMNVYNIHDKQNLVHIGIFEIVGNYASGQRGNNMRFIDKFDICKYFPGYLRQKKHWLTYKGNEMDGRTVVNMCRGMYKKAKTIFDY